MKRLTIKDVASAAGVNPSTVSRALNNHPDISSELKKKITEIAEKLDYSPSAAALNLKNNSTKTIGLIIPTISKFFLPDVLQAINDVLIEYNFKLAIFNSDNDVLMEERQIKLCAKSQLDGIIISLTNETTNLNHLEYASRYDIPIVLFDKVIPNNKYTSVIINDQAAAKKCGEYLQSKGCTNIVGLFGNENLEITKMRYKGIKNYFEKEAPNNIEFKPLFASNAMKAYNCLTAYCKENKNIDGLFFMSDEVLLGATSALYEQDLLFKVNMVTISDGASIKFNIPRIPYILHSGYEVGKSAANKLMQLISNKEANKAEQVLIATPFIEV